MSIGQLVTRYSFFFIKVFILRFDRKHVDYETSLLNEVAPGPVGIISSLYVLYAVNIPTSYYFKILLQKPKGLEERREEVGGGGGGGEEDEGGESFKARSNKNSSRELTLSNQFPVHTLFILLLLNNGFKSLIPAVVGLLIGKLYAYDLLPGGTSWFVPKFIFQLFINPRRKLLQSLQLIHQRIFNPRYQPLTISESTDPSAIRMNSEEPEDNDDLLDETRRQESQIRAETPVRPLGSQFLDTFRT
ncbi:hypothetical protein KGF56_002939 [Candida oxycetoniae]|uniref:Uncharacterized protein n=1 Tax=Candida oxycetoniae TaxID=497107 RepID=A0AAI9SX04_9ASCO|nr:uncharacterized protein KGF56_002939 [Candida oxycetoniae]KAI3404300.2 hypothetical protein KGF56_002939 [Candida oxycetoniae]